MLGRFEWCPFKPQETCCKSCQSRQSRYIAKCLLSSGSKRTLGTFPCCVLTRFNTFLARNWKVIILFPGWAAVAAALRSGRRPRARVLPGGPLVVTEGYRRCAPCRRNLPTHPGPTDDPVISVFCGVSGPSAATDFILAMFKNHGFYVVLGSRTGLGEEKLAS